MASRDLSSDLCSSSLSRLKVKAETLTPACSWLENESPKRSFNAERSSALKFDAEAKNVEAFCQTPCIS